MINRLKLAWHVLRGRPLIYGVTIEGCTHIAPGIKSVTIVGKIQIDTGSGALVTGCTFVPPVLSPEEQARANEIGRRLLVQREALRQARVDG